MHSLFNRLKERKLGQWALAYLAGAWVLLQVFGELRDTFAWPPVIVQVLTVVLGVGFFAALVLAWFHGEKGQQRVSGVELLMLAGILLAAGALVSFVSRNSPADAATVKEGAAIDAGSVAAAPAERSIAVLPFVNMSSDPEQEYFSDGITEELLNALAKVDGLKVAARTSSFRFKGKHLPVDSVGRALKVAHVLEGSVRKSGNRLRITAQLIKAQDGFHLWSETYDRELADVFEVQDEIARSITQALRVKLAGGSDATLVKEATSDPVAYQLYLQGLYRISRLDDDAGIALFEQAIARDPQFAPAHAALASAIGERPALDRRTSPLQAMETSRREAQRALALDPMLPDAHVALGEVQYRYEWDFRRAEESFRRATQLNPNHSGAYRNRGNVLLLLRRPDEALALARRAVEVDPINPLNACVEAWMLLHARRYLETLGHLQTARRQHDLGCGEAWFETFYMLGRYKDALTEARIYFRGDRPALEAALLIQMADEVLGAKIRGEQPSPESVRRVDQSGIRMQRLHLAKWYTWAGDHDAAIQVIEEMVAERDPYAVYATYSYFDPLRSDPRYGALLAKMGLR